MFKKEKIKRLEEKLVLLEKSLLRLQEDEDLILNHLQIKIWESEPIPGKKEIISKEEFVKRSEEKFKGYDNCLSQLLMAQQSALGKYR